MIMHLTGSDPFWQQAKWGPPAEGMLEGDQYKVA